MEIETYQKLLSRIEEGKIPPQKLQVIYDNAKQKTDKQATNLINIIINYTEKNEVALYKKLVPESNVSRKEFMTNEGFTCANWLWSWSFVNHEKKIIAFGAWNTAYTDEKHVVILSNEWKGEDRVAAGFNQALEHIELANKKGYQYQVFNMIHGGFDNNDRSKIAGISPKLINVTVEKVEGDWIATVINKNET